MTNGEKYRDDIFREYDSSSNFCKEFIQKRILGTDNCDGKTCTQCKLMQMVWLNEEYKELEVDWSKVEVDTPIFVSQYPILHSDVAVKRYFSKFENGKVFAWKHGRTSFSAIDKYDYAEWEYAKLVEENNGL